VPAAGAPFDPAVHDAVSRHEDAAAAGPTVAEELQRGYTMHERLLRPALVKVAMPASGRGRPGGAEEAAREEEG
jgi:molecular chaperone GrpE